MRGRLLTPVRKELADLRLDLLGVEEAIHRLEEVRKGTTEQIELQRDEATAELSAISHTKEVMQVSVSSLENQKLTINSEITVAENKLRAKTNDNTVAQTAFDDLTEKVAHLTEDTEGLTMQKQALEMEIAQSTIDFDMQTKDTQKKLDVITLKLNNSVKTLQDTQRLEEQLRGEFATRQVALDKREEVLANRENALKQQEDRVYNYAKALNI